MHSAIRSQGISAFLRQEAPFLITAFIIAELFYKWKSFALECGGFLVTWYVLSLAASYIAPLLAARASGSSNT